MTVREEVEKMLKSKVLKGFRATFLAKKTGVSLPEVVQELDKMIEEGILSSEYEYLCPNCLRSVDFDKLEDEEDCTFCGEELDKGEVSDTKQKIYKPKK